MFKKLRNKFIILNMTIISVVMIAAFAVIYIMTYTNIKSANVEKLQNLSASGRVIRQSTIADEEIKSVNVIASSEYAPSFHVVTDNAGRIINVASFFDIPYETCVSAAKTAIDKNGRSDTLSFEDRLWIFSVRELGNIHFTDGGFFGKIVRFENCVQVSFLDITESQKILSQLLITFGIIGFAMLFIIFGISVFFAKRAIAPVEITYSKQKQFIADASHELKTPIASINANTDVLLANKEESVESQTKWIDYIKGEAERMEKLVGDLLYLAKTEDASLNAANLPFNMSDTIRSAVLSMEAVVYEKGLRLEQAIEPNIIVSGDGGKFSQAVKILFDNALKYSDEKGKIEMKLKQTKQQVVFSITNSGKGIPKEHLSKVFDRFYRADPSRTHDGGYGLGLAIAKAIIDNMGGSIYASSVEGKNTTFTITLNK